MNVCIYSEVDGAKEAKGVVVIIDVLRAATVASYLLDKGVTSITPVSTRDEAFALKKVNQEVLLIGEEGGIKIDGFDIGNSPSEIKTLSHLKHKQAIHRSSTGTQGLVNAHNADTVIFGTFTTCSAIASYIIEKSPADVSLISMGGLEDVLFAEYLKHQLLGEEQLSMQEIISELEEHPGCQWYFDSDKISFPKEDFYLSLALDTFDFFPILNNGRLVKSTDI